MAGYSRHRESVSSRIRLEMEIGFYSEVTCHTVLDLCKNLCVV